MATIKSEYKILWELKQRTPEWFKARENLLTGSEAKEALTSKDTIVYKLVAKLCAITDEDDDDYKSKKMKRGQAKEPEAIKAYEKKTGNKVLEAGIIINGENGHSPDGLVMRSKESIKRVIEIKAKDQHSHIRIIDKEQIPAEHRAQCIHALIVASDAEAVDFVSYDDRVPYCPIKIITLWRKDCETEIMVAKRKYEQVHRDKNALFNKLINTN